MSDTTTSNSRGMGLVGVLTCIFVVLKLIGIINWSWWWVLSPLWISAGLFFVILILVGIVAGIAYLVTR